MTVVGQPGTQVVLGAGRRTFDLLELRAVALELDAADERLAIAAGTTLQVIAASVTLDSRGIARVAAGATLRCHVPERRVGDPNPRALPPGDVVFLFDDGAQMFARIRFTRELAPLRGRARDRAGARRRGDRRDRSEFALERAGVPRHRVLADRPDPRARPADVGDVHAPARPDGVGRGRIDAMNLRRIASALGVLVLLWLVVLWVLDSAYADGYGRRVGERVGESLGAKGSVAVTDLALVRGYVQMDHLDVQRDDEVGKLSLKVDAIRCDVAPLGWALVDSTCDVLAVRGMRLDASTDKVFHVERPRRAPIHARAMIVDDAQLTFAPSAFAPKLGRIAIRVDHAESGDTVFRTPLSWLFSLRELRASIDLPAGITVQLAYHDGKLSAAGTLFGSSTVTLPVTLPQAGSLTDGRAEIHALVELGEDLAEKLVTRRAEDWLRTKLSR